MDDQEAMEFDVLIVGAGPSGLAAAIRLKQLSQEQNHDISVCVVEKGAEVGAHILSGAVLETRALNSLIPDWKEKGAPIRTAVEREAFSLLTKKGSVRLPTPPQMCNKGNYIISLGNLCRWLGEQAMELGVEIYPGFTAKTLVVGENGTIRGIKTGEFGLAKDDTKKDTYQPPVKLLAKYTLFGEGCRGFLTEQLISRFQLRTNADSQTYALGLKELWEIDPAKHKEGSVLHTIGWPLDRNTYGGSFVYHMADNQLAIGFVVGLDYENPYCSPYQEFQRFKTHPSIRPLLEGGKRLSYGARALNEGGFQSVPQLTFPGGALIGCAAGFMNVAKIKGTHTAMQSGILAAESVFHYLMHVQDKRQPSSYCQAVKESWIYDELYRVRNIRPSFQFGLWRGLAYSAFDTYIMRGKAPWTFKHKPDHQQLKPASEYTPIEYPEPDNVVSFDRLSSVYLSNTNHEEDQPCHLYLKNEDVAIQTNLEVYAAPEQYYCPAGVYEIVEDEAGEKRLQINAQNCLHCKTCDIKDPTQNIVWMPPEGTGGPQYSNM